MDTKTASLKKVERQVRADRVRRFKAARDRFIDDLASGRVSVPTHTAKICAWLFIPPIFAVPIFYRTRTIVDLRLVDNSPGIRLTTHGQLVHAPGAYKGFWSRDGRPESHTDLELIVITQRLLAITA